MQVWNLLHAALWKQDAKKLPKIAMWAPSHNFVGLYLCNQGTYRQSEKNLLSSNMSFTCPHNMVNFGPVWGTPPNFNGLRVLAALLHSSKVVSVSQTLRCWTEGATYVWQGDHHVGHWPTFLVLKLDAFMSCLQDVCGAASIACQHVSVLHVRRVCPAVLCRQSTSAHYLLA